MLTPAFSLVIALSAGAAPASPATPLRVQVLLDGSYGHKQELKAVFREASSILSSQLGVGLEIADVKPWKPSKAASVNVRAALSELEHGEKFPDADIVAAFIREPPRKTDDYKQLGNAHPLGKEVVVRAAADAHEEAVVLVHQVAHALGGVHVADASSILSASYDKGQKSFTEDQLALLKPGIAFKHAGNDVARASAAAQVTRELQHRRAKLDSAGGDAVQAALDELAGKARADLVLPPDQARVVNDAVAAMNAGDTVRAWKLLKPLAEKKDAPMQALSVGCRIMSSPKVTDLDRRLCDRAVAKSTDLDSANAAIRWALRIKDAAATKRAFAEGRARLQRVRQPGADVDELAALAQGTGRLALAEEALDKSTAPDVKERRHTLAVERMRSGVPKGLLSYEDEAGVLDALSVISRTPRADKGDAIDRAVRRYGEVPGLLVERCDWQTDKERYRDAEASCEEAVKKFDGGSVAHLVLGIAYAQDDLVSKAIPHLEKTIALDPDNPDAYTSLWPLYHQVGKHAEQARIEAEYQKRFGKPLPH